MNVLGQKMHAKLILLPQWDTELSILNINGTCELLIRPYEPSHEQTQRHFHLK